MGFIKTSGRPVSYCGTLTRNAHTCPMQSLYIRTHAHVNFHTSSPLALAVDDDDGNDNDDDVGSMNV